MKIYINNDILSRFRDEKISLDYVGTTIAILICLYERNYDLLDAIDDKSKSKRLQLLYRYLVTRNMIELADENEESLYVLTEKGSALTAFILSFNENEMEVRQECISEIMDVEQKVEEWINEYIDIFPEGKYFGRTLKMHPSDCIGRMKWFIKTYGYNKDQILQATKNYINAKRESPDGHKYTKNAAYFIYKGREAIDRISDLATECGNLSHETAMAGRYIERDSA